MRGSAAPPRRSGVYGGWAVTSDAERPSGLPKEPFQANVIDSFKPVVTATDGKVYGVPEEASMGGGILYNKKIYAELGLSVPKTWAEFMANNEKIKAAGKVAVIQTFGDTSAAVEGSSNALTVNLWGRLRWPTGLEAFHRPVRWVAEAQHSQFLGDPQAALGFEYLTKFGGGLELDTGALKIGALGLYMERVRLVGRYVFGLNVSGFSVGLGVTF